MKQRYNLYLAPGEEVALRRRRRAMSERAWWTLVWLAALVSLLVPGCGPSGMTEADDGNDNPSPPMDASVDPAPDADLTSPQPDAAPNGELCTPVGENAVDDDGDGEVDEGCPCQPGATQACCGNGIQVCEPASGEFGSVWGPCTGAELEPEICEDGIDQNCDGVDDDCPDVQVACNQSPHQVQSSVLHFPGDVGNCPWNQGDNNGYIGGHFGARIEHVQSLTLPPGAIICDLDFNVPQSGMYYDDSFLLAFDEAILLTDMDVDVYFPNANGLFLYDWSHIDAQPVIRDTYCLGGGPCQLPDTQNQGTISLTLPQPLVYALSQRALSLNRFDFLVVATGDDNPSIDCAYSAFDLEVTVEYVIP